MPLFRLIDFVGDLLEGDFIPDYGYWYHDIGMNQDDSQRDRNENEEMQDMTSQEKFSKD